MFDAECVLHQIRSLQVTPTVQLMAAGTDMTDLSASHTTSTQMQGHRRCSHNILVCVSLCERLATRLNNISYCTIIHSAWLRRKTSSWMSFGWQRQNSYGQSHQRHSFKNSFARNVRSSPHPPPFHTHTQRFLLSVYDTSIRPVMPYYISGKGVKKYKSLAKLTGSKVNVLTCNVNLECSQYYCTMLGTSGSFWTIGMMGFHAQRVTLFICCKDSAFSPQSYLEHGAIL